jgi:hypothetical protein
MYFITPERDNIMSYWNRTCRGGQPHLSNGQAAVVRNALEQGNRAPLIAPKRLYSAVWEAGARFQKRAVATTYNDISNRMQIEIGAGGHAVHVQAYDNGNGIRWDVIWEAGSTNQTFALRRTLLDFTRLHERELSQGRRLVHMQAYEIGHGDVRWDAIWEPGGANQTWTVNLERQDFTNAFDQQIADGQHFTRMQAYVVDGEPRYDAIWESGSRGTTYAVGLDAGSFATRFDAEVAAGKYLVHMQSYDLGSGQRRWDGVWEDGYRANAYVIGYALDEFVSQLETRSILGYRLLHMQAYEAADGSEQVRYDAVWEVNGSSTQHRVVSESLGAFDEERVAGFYLVKMQAHAGR